jgi:hypothetical protein
MSSSREILQIDTQPETAVRSYPPIPNPGSETALPSTTTASENQATMTSRPFTATQPTPYLDPNAGGIFEQKPYTRDTTSLSGGVIFGIIMGIAAVIVIALCASRMYIKRRERERKMERDRTKFSVTRATGTRSNDVALKRLPDLPI